MDEPTRHESPWQRAWRRLRRSRSAWVGAALVMLLVVCAVAAPLLAPYNPERLVADQLLSPSWQHPLGTDSVGRDNLSRVIYGARLSFVAGLVSITVAISIGAPLGAIAGYAGGKIDALIMRAVDVILSFPSLLVALLVVVALEPGWIAVMIAVGTINIPVFCRQIRATTLGVREADFVVAARAAGATPGYILVRAIFPSLVNPLVVLATLGLGTAILEVAGLSFLGIAGEISVPEWGNMLTAAKNNLRTSLWPALAPGLAISLSVIGFNLLGDGLRDALDPHLRWD
ncbi:MAG: ABC transporter permease [Pirellulales bacterium]|nr:ABC transporter permease [Pirellulales bacterium]